LPPPLGAQFTAVREHVAIEVPGIVRDHDVDRGQAAVVLPRLAGEAHRYLFRRGVGSRVLL